MTTYQEKVDTAIEVLDARGFEETANQLRAERLADEESAHYLANKSGLLGYLEDKYRPEFVEEFVDYLKDDPDGLLAKLGYWKNPFVNGGPLPHVPNGVGDQWTYQRVNDPVQFNTYHTRQTSE